MGARAATLAADEERGRAAFGVDPATRPGGRAALALVLAWSALGCATASPPSVGDPELRLLRFEGNRAVPQQVIEDGIVTEGRSWVPFSAKRYYDEAILETDLKRILRLYQAEGYYEARVVGRTVTPAGDDRVDLTVRLDEGSPTLLAQLTLAGLDALPGELRAQLLKDSPLREGEVFKEEALEAFQVRLTDSLAEAGYAQASVSGQALVEVLGRRAEVTILARPGRRFHFGEIQVLGISEVPPERIAAEARVALPEAGVYRSSALAEARRRLLDLGVFSTVGVTLGKPEGDSLAMPIIVTVEEAPLHSLRVGAGLGLDPRFTELPRLSAEWTDRNFLGGLRRVTLLGSASLVFLPSLWVSFSGQAPELDVAFHSGVRLEQPGVIGRDTSLTASLGVERGVDAAFSYIEGRASVGLVYRYRRSLEFAPSYHFSMFSLAGAAAAAMTLSSQEAVLDACGAGRICRLAYLEQRLSYDLRDNPVETTRGAYLALSVQEGSRYLGGGYDYLRFLPELRGYLPLGPVVVAVRVQAGLLVPLSEAGSSVLTRFFLGGGASERGFGNRQLSPAFVACRYRDPTTRACRTAAQAGHSQGTDVTEVLPVGGNGMVGANLELRIPLPADFGLVAFVDAGEVTPGLGDLRLDGIHVAVGLGLRYQTVLGPVRLDVAYRVNDPRRDYTFATDLPAGAQPSPISRFALHFGIGEAF